MSSLRFHAEFTPAPFPVKLKHSNRLLLSGSCFTEQIGGKLAAHKFDVLENPNGILFNPVSIAKAIISYTDEKLYTADDLFCYNEMWASWQHHTKFSSPNPDAAIAAINASQAQASHYVKSADWIFITLGSAFVYEIKNNNDATGRMAVAANCHKIPADKFTRRLLTTGEIVNSLKAMMEAVLAVNKHAKFIFTISPVRHLREGFIDNNRSKAALIHAVHELANATQVFYFPAYELVIDDLRDYRFFAEDLVHPNYTATNYVWEKFVAAAVDEDSQKLMAEINEINAAKKHKAFNEHSDAHKAFKLKYSTRVKLMQQKYSYINFNEEIKYFAD